MPWRLTRWTVVELRTVSVLAVAVVLFSETLAVVPGAVAMSQLPGVDQVVVEEAGSQLALVGASVRTRSWLGLVV